MNTHTHTKTAITLAVMIVAGTFIAPAAAYVTKTSSNHQNAGGNCHASRAKDEESMERSALGYRNTARYDSRRNTDVQVTCNFANDAFAAGRRTGNVIKAVQLFARIAGPSGQDVSMACTITAGYATQLGRFTNTKTISFPRRWEQDAVSWTAVDNGNRYLPGPASVVCSVPPGVELNDAIVVFDVDVGL